VNVIDGLMRLQAIPWLEDANDLLVAAGMAGLSPTVKPEASLLSALRLRPKHIYIDTVPPLPSLVVGRTAQLQKVKERLLDTRATTQLVRVQSISSVHGWAGVGKTTFAALLAHDDDVRRVFVEGVLWTSLGQTPKVIAQLGAWGRTLGDATVARAPDSI
jgi:hypothetical protein